MFFFEFSICLQCSMLEVSEVLRNSLKKDDPVQHCHGTAKDYKD